ncbi:MAG: hypothetical protein M3345_06605 [Actinomycetota bacterium]|nr:hypothetical protein [Actinomycetota bacterium]
MAMRYLRRAATIMWAAPSSAVGALFAPFFRRRYITRGVLLCEGASWPRRLGWRYRAITFGRVVLSVDELDEGTFQHELVHVRQYDRWGPLFIPAYVLASIWARFSGRHHYRDNPFEVAARGHGSHPGDNATGSPVDAKGRSTA